MLFIAQKRSIISRFFNSNCFSKKIDAYICNINMKSNDILQQKLFVAVAFKYTLQGSKIEPPEPRPTATQLMGGLMPKQE